MTEILDRAGNLPVEFQAAIFFQIIKSRPETLSRASQINRYRELFDRAPSAVFHSRIFYGGHNPESLESQEVNELSAGQLDELSIKAKVIESLSLLAPSVSYDLLRRLSIPAQSIPCQQASIPNYEAYYEAVQSLAQTNKSQATWSQDDLISIAIDAINSPSMLEGWLQSIPSWNLRQAQWLSIAHLTADRFEALRPTDRELTSLDRYGRYLNRSLFWSQS